MATCPTHSQTEGSTSAYQPLIMCKRDGANPRTPNSKRATCSSSPLQAPPLSKAGLLMTSSGHGNGSPSHEARSHKSLSGEPIAIIAAEPPFHTPHSTRAPSATNPRAMAYRLANLGGVNMVYGVTTSFKHSKGSISCRIGEHHQEDLHTLSPLPAGCKLAQLSLLRRFPGRMPR